MITRLFLFFALAIFSSQLWSINSQLADFYQYDANVEVSYDQKYLYDEGGNLSPYRDKWIRVQKEKTPDGSFFTFIDFSNVTKSTGKTAKEGIYELTDTAGKKYCGQSCNIPNCLKQHQKTGKLDSNQSVQTTEVLGGKTAREIAEHKRIQGITGGVPARFSDKVSNKVDPIGPNRSHLLD